MVETKDATGKVQEASDSIATLQDELDELWARYLDCLHQYQTAMTAVSQQFARGFLSLAQANMRSPPGQRRYGQDFYDERAKASRHCRISLADNARPVFMTSGPDLLQPPSIEEKKAQQEPKQQPSPPATPNIDTEDEAKGEVPNEGEKSNASLCDPLRWFGILLPKQLRSTQSAFVAALDEPIIRAVNKAREMRDVETEIRRLQKSLKKQEKTAAAALPSS